MAMLEIVARTPQGVEVIDYADTAAEAIYLIDEYHLAWGDGYAIWFRPCEDDEEEW